MASRFEEAPHTKEPITITRGKFLAAIGFGAAKLSGVIGAIERTKPLIDPEARGLIAKNIGGHAVINGKPELLIGTGWLSPDNISDARALGINTFLTRKQGIDQSNVFKAAGSQDFIAPEYSERNLQRWDLHPNTIGYVQSEDEADDKSIEPSSLPQTQRAAKTGKLIFQTLTYRLLDGFPNPEGISDSDYKAYMDNADVVLTTVYPDAYRLPRSSVYDAIIESRRLGQDSNKVYGEWLNTGPVGGDTAPIPEAASAEAWAVAAAGGTAIFWFMPEMDIKPEMRDIIINTNHELQRCSNIILSPRVPNINSLPEDPIKVGLFKTPNDKAALIAVNLSDQEVGLSKDTAAKQWLSKLPKKLDYDFKPFEPVVFKLN